MKHIESEDPALLNELARRCRALSGVLSERQSRLLLLTRAANYETRAELAGSQIAVLGSPARSRPR